MCRTLQGTAFFPHVYLKNINVEAYFGHGPPPPWSCAYSGGVKPEAGAKAESADPASGEFFQDYKFIETAPLEHRARYAALPPLFGLCVLYFCTNTANVYSI